MGRPRNQSADAYLDSPELIFVAEGLNVLFPVLWRLCASRSTRP